MNLKVKYVKKPNNFVSLPETKKALLKKIDPNNLNTSCLKLIIPTKDSPIYVGTLKSLESFISPKKQRNSNIRNILQNKQNKRK